MTEQKGSVGDNGEAVLDRIQTTPDKWIGLVILDPSEYITRTIGWNYHSTWFKTREGHCTFLLAKSNLANQIRHNRSCN